MNPKLAIVLAVGLLTSAGASAQVTLTVNGQTSGNNGLAVTVQQGTTLQIEIDNPSSPNAFYGLFGGPDNNGAATGWYLQDNGVIDPFPIVTGISTARLEAQLSGLGLMISPSRPLSPFYRLNGQGSVTLSFNVPKSFLGSIPIQAATLEQGLIIADISNAIELNIVAAVQSARLLVSRDVTPGDADDLEFGVFSFAGNPANGNYVPVLSNIDTDDLLLAGINEWSRHNQTGNPKEIQQYRDSQAVVNFGNDEFVRVSLPSVGNVPRRDLLNRFDSINQEAFYLIINKGDNPNTPGEDFHVIEDSRLTDSIDPTKNSYRSVIAVSPDHRVIAAVFQDRIGDADQLFLIAVDGTEPYNDGGGPSAVIDVTPSGVPASSMIANSMRFTENQVFVVLDDGVDVDLDNRSHRLFTADWTSTQPSTVEVNDFLTGGGATVDYIAGSSIMVSQDRSTLVFLAGDTSIAGDNNAVGDGDWYRVLDSSASIANNLSDVPSGDVILEPGHTYNGITGFASLSPDGSALAFVSENSIENGQTEKEIYLASTDGSDSVGLLGNPVTSNSFFASDVETTLTEARDLCLLSESELLFFYGADFAADAASTDLFFYDRNEESMVNLTETGGIDFPIDQAGDISPEGYFRSPSGRYLYFARGRALDPNLVNFVGLDTLSMSIFNVTGSEFPGFGTDSAGNTGVFGDNSEFELTFAGGDFPSLMYFASNVDSGSTGQEVWAFDADFPFPALRLTNDQVAGETVIELAPNPKGLGISFGKTVNGNAATADLFYRDLAAGVTTNLTMSGGTVAPTFGGSMFVPPRVADGVDDGVPAGLVAASGFGLGENPTDATILYSALDDVIPTPAGMVDTGGTLLGNLLQIYHVSID